MKQYELTGGARVGMANATFPFAKLKVDEDKLELNASIIGKLIFAPKDIISIEPYQQMPIVGKGVKIIHRVSSYKDNVIFWTFKNPQVVIDEIRKTGFMDKMNSNFSEDDKRIVAQQKEGGFPVKKSFTIGAVILWNLLFAFDFYKFYNSSEGGIPIGIGAKVAIGLLLATALITLFSKPFQKLILKENRKLDDVKRFIYFIIFISSFLLLNFILITKFN